MFLPDRYIKGECPKCGTPGPVRRQLRELRRGLLADRPEESALGGLRRDAGAARFRALLLPAGQVRGRCCASGSPATSRTPSVKAKLGEWLEGGLRDWDISRDAPYFGFPIPDAPGKFFYVWLDAPIGYLASFRAFCDAHRHRLRRVPAAPAARPRCTTSSARTSSISTACSGRRCCTARACARPTRLHVNGYLMVNGAKMSKSRGTFIMARTFLDAGLDPEALRYYFATKSGGGVDDLDLNLEDFVARVNSDLVGKFVNLASRASRLRHASLRRRARPPLRGRRQRSRQRARWPAWNSIRSPLSRPTISPPSRARRCACATCSTSAGTKPSPGCWRRTRREPTSCSSVCSECLLGFYVVAGYLAADPAGAVRAARWRLFERAASELSMRWPATLPDARAGRTKPC